MLRFPCANCTEKLVVPERFAGRKGKCPACGTINRVPASSQFAVPLATGMVSPTVRQDAVAVPPMPAAAPIAMPPEVPQAAPRPVPPPASLAPPPPSLPMLLPAGPVGPETLRPKPVEVEMPAAAMPVLDDSPGKLVAMNPLDDVGLPPLMKWLAVLGILLLLVLAVWVIFYLLIWTQVKLNQ